MENIRHGQGIVAKVEARKKELEQTLAAVQSGAVHGADLRAKPIEDALLAVGGLLTGSSAQLTDATVTEPMTWLERTKTMPAQ